MRVAVHVVHRGNQRAENLQNENEIRNLLTTPVVVQPIFGLSTLLLRLIHIIVVVVVVNERVCQFGESVNITKREKCFICLLSCLTLRP